MKIIVPTIIILTVAAAFTRDNPVLSAQSSFLTTDA